MKKITVEIAVRFRDIDVMGHVNNAVYLTYFEEGRKAFLREVLGIVDQSDYPFILARITCDFLRPITLQDTVSLSVWVSGTGTKSFTFRYELSSRDDNSVLFGTGESVMVMYDYAAKKTVSLPEELLNKISKYCE